MTSAFWNAFETASRSEAQFRSDRQERLEKAEEKARSFHESLLADAARLREKQVAVTRADRTVSFRRGSSELLAVIFGTHDGTEVTIVSPIVEYLKLNPSYEELRLDSDVVEAAGRWLSRSLDVLEKHRDTFSPLGFAS